MQEKPWLYEDRQCEARFMESFKSDQGMLFSLTYKMFIDGSLDSDFIWLLFNYQFSENFKIKNGRGNLEEKPNIEVDIIGGKCKSVICEESSYICIQPLLDYFIAIEVKCSRYDYKEEDEKNRLKAKQEDDEQEGIQKQLYDRLKMGFNKVSSLDILFTNQGTGRGIGAWLNASDKIDNVHNIMEKEGIFERRLDNEALDAVGQYFFGKGSVRKDDINEFLSGSGEAVVKKQSKLNPFLEDTLKDTDVIENRKIMERIFKNMGMTKQFNSKFDWRKYPAFYFPRVSLIKLNKRFNLYLFLTNFNK